MWPNILNIIVGIIIIVGGVFIRQLPIPGQVSQIGVVVLGFLVVVFSLLALKKR